MKLMPSPNAKLICPKCGGEIKTIHPYYTASDKLVVVGMKHQVTWYIVAGILMGVWWPIGVIVFILAFFKGINEAKTAILYRCAQCSTELSYSEAVATNET